MPFLFRSENPDKSGPAPMYRGAFRSTATYGYGTYDTGGRNRVLNKKLGFFYE